MAILNADYSNLNLDDMAAKIGLKPKHIPMLLGSFLEESGEILKKLSKSIEISDFDNIRAYAHSVKGSAGNLQFTEIYKMAQDIEYAATANDDTFEYKLYFDAVNTAFDTIQI